MRLEVIGELKDGTLELEGPEGRQYTARVEKDDEGLITAIILERADD